MSVSIKSEREIELMREAGRILARVHEELGKMIKPGISTLDIDRAGERMIRSYGCAPSFKNYNGYPASICVSVNDEVVPWFHLPSPEFPAPYNSRSKAESDHDRLSDASERSPAYHHPAKPAYPDMHHTNPMPSED